MSEVRRIFGGNSTLGDFTEIEFTVDNDGEVYVRDVTKNMKANRVFIPLEVLEDFLRVRGELHLSAREVEEA